MKILTLITLCCLLCFYGCGIHNRAGNKDVDTFFKGKGNMLFYVSAVKIKGVKKAPNLYADFTYDFLKDSVGSVIIHYSVYGKAFLARPYTTKIHNTTLDSVELMFAELRGRRYHTRLYASMPFENFSKMVLSDTTVEWKIGHAQGEYIFRTNSIWKKKARKIRTQMLDVIRLSS